MYNKIKALVREARQISHVPEPGLELKVFPLSDLPVPGQLCRGIVQDGNPSPSRRQDRPLLSPARGEAKNVCLRHVCEPLTGHRPAGREQNAPVPAAGAGDLLGTDRDSPAIAVSDLLVPSASVVCQDVYRCSVRGGHKQSQPSDLWLRCHSVANAPRFVFQDPRPRVLLATMRDANPRDTRRQAAARWAGPSFCHSERSRGPGP
jgi:hypothetical protein